MLAAIPWMACLSVADGQGVSHAVSRPAAALAGVTERSPVPKRAAHAVAAPPADRPVRHSVSQDAWRTSRNVSTEPTARPPLPPSHASAARGIAPGPATAAPTATHAATRVDYFRDPFGDAQPQAPRGSAATKLASPHGGVTRADGSWPDRGGVTHAVGTPENNQPSLRELLQASAPAEPETMRPPSPTWEQPLPAPVSQITLPDDPPYDVPADRPPADEFPDDESPAGDGDAAPPPGRTDSPADVSPAPGPGAMPQANPFGSRVTPPPATDRTLPRPQPPAAEDSYQFFDELQPIAAGISCDEFRQRIRERTIRDVSLDISPPFRPDILDQADYEREKADFDDRQPIRTWRSVDGRELGKGSFRDLAYEKVVIETAFGTTEELPVSRLSEADLAYVSESWGLPYECRLEEVEFAPRNWNPSTITWNASNLYHYPLYFQEVNLERYGHTAGPILQPVVSSAHFFANIAVLPYKMGVHPPNECQYALGYYRPGNCAPWILPPVPISLRGGLTQAAVMSGAILLVP